jgi:serine/threonine-protein phosphatase PPG1
MSHILRAHQLCNEGYQVLFDDRLSTVWSAPNYCYRCGNLASVLEVGDKMQRYFNIFDAAPENDVHRSEQQAQQNRDSQPTIDYFL